MSNSLSHTCNYSPNHKLDEFSLVIIWDDTGEIFSTSFSRANLHGISGNFVNTLDGLGVNECAIIEYPRNNKLSLGESEVYLSGVFTHLTYGLESWENTSQHVIRAVMVKRHSVAEYHSTNKRLGAKDSRYTWIQLPLSGFMPYSEEYSIYTRLKGYNAIKHNGLHSF